MYNSLESEAHKTPRRVQNVDPLLFTSDTYQRACALFLNLCVIEDEFVFRVLLLYEVPAVKNYHLRMMDLPTLSKLF